MSRNNFNQLVLLAEAEKLDRVGRITQFISIMRNKKDALKSQFDAFKGSEIKATSHIQGGKDPDNDAETQRLVHTWSGPHGGIDHETGDDNTF